MVDNDKSSQSKSRDWGTRRDVLKGATAAGAGGLLGSLAGCQGDDSGSDDGGSSETDTSGDDTSTGGDGSGGSESLTLSFISPDPTESGAHKDFYQEQMQQYGERKENVEVDLQSLGWGAMSQKLPAMARNDSLPDAAMAGGTAMAMWIEEDNLIDHGSFIEGTEGIPENLHRTTTSTINYRDKWWSAGTQYTQATQMAVVPRFFKEVGVDDPSQLATWTGFRQAVEDIHQQFPNVHAFEETGVTGDLETYWGEARTAYTGGEDPWIDTKDQGTYDDPVLKVGEEGRTDGMILNCLEMGLRYSSDEVASRSNENIQSLLLTERVASSFHDLGRLAPWTSVKEDVSFGWDGDIHILPLPKLDPEYGNEFDIPELAGAEGEHGGNAWGFDIMHTGFDTTSSPEESWALMDYISRHEDFVLPYLGEIQTTAPSYTPHLSTLEEEYDIRMPQQTLLDSLEEYPDQYMPCGGDWDLPSVPTLRWDALNQTISEALAGQHEPAETPGLIRSRMEESL